MDYRMSVVLQGDSGHPDDRYVNNFAMASDTALLAAEFQAAAEAVARFYTDTPAGGTYAVYTRFGKQVAKNNHQVKFYELGNPPPNLPVYTRNFDLPVEPDADSLPSEVAVCLSLMGAPVAGTFVGPGPHLPARHRGRVYIGPLSADVTDFYNGAVRPDTQFLDNIGAAGQALGTDLILVNATSRWTIWSETNGSSTDTLNIYLDDAFDTQRRRGAAAASRRGPIAAF